MHFFQKTSCFILILSLILGLNIPFISKADSSDTSEGDVLSSIFGQAGIFSSAGLIKADPGVKKIITQILEDFGMEKEELLKATSQVNYMSYKTDAPQVNVQFVPTNPIPGKELTAIAETSLFRNKPNDMYFTWFLKRARCEEEPGSCDYNKDGETDIEDYKIEAMRIIASGNFEWQKILGKDDPNCTSEYPPDHCSLPNQYEGESGNNNDSDEYLAVFGGDDQVGKNSYCFARNVETGEDIEMESCEHLFPDVSSFPGLKDEKVGDGHFGAKEESFWRTDPNSNDTSSSGVMDEASVAGLGKMEFKWIYSPGDKIGVAVEGISTGSTSTKDSSFKTMWAISNNPDIIKTMGNGKENGDWYFHFNKKGDAYCGGKDGDCNVQISCSSENTTKAFANPGIPGKYEESNPAFKWKAEESSNLVILIDKSYPEGCEVCVNFDDNGEEGQECKTSETKLEEGEEEPEKPTIESINESLDDAFVEPTAGRDYKKINNNLSVSNSKPQYDSSTGGANSDTVAIRSNTTNNEDSGFTYYKWELAIAESPDSSNWRSLTQTDLGGNFPLEGIGLRELNIPLDSIKKEVLAAKGISENASAFYVRATLKTKENSSTDVTKEGLETTIITVQNSKGEIKVHSAKADAATGKLTHEEKERCTAESEKFICPVTPDEIISARIPTEQYNPSKFNFSWTLDGERLSPENSDNNLIYFPITEEIGKAYVLKLDIAGKDSAEKITLTRSFSISEPTANIKSTDPNNLSPVLMGQFVDKDKGLQWDDYSKDFFQAVAGSTVKLQAPNNTASLGTTTWTVDGEEIINTNNSSIEAFVSDGGNTLNLPVTKQLGASYTITSTTSHKQDEATKKALYDKWNISRSNLSENDIVKTIKVIVSDNINGEKKITYQKKDENKILASLFSGLPGYISFLFKIIVTFALIIFSSSLILSISPERKEY
ncbi:MAG: hypothetical protein ACD_15C00063G0001 [uncultured bacterium]|nr:MAG: hypothetical protein ACD_15C00063G0001 [uncultured bacterium]HCU70762.1 hypothetical protein [Candidatus Moranbacteria bacterium]